MPDLPDPPHPPSRSYHRVHDQLNQLLFGQLLEIIVCIVQFVGSDDVAQMPGAERAELTPQERLALRTDGKWIENRAVAARLWR